MMGSGKSAIGKILANKLLEKGFPVTEDTVNTYKVNLLAQQELMEGSL